MTVNLHALTARIAEQHPGIADPGELAELLFQSLDPRDYADALRQTLRGYVRVTVNNLDRRQEPVATAPAVRRAPTRSSYVEAMQAGVWRQRLEAGFPGVDGTWKLLRDFTLADCEAAAAEYQRRAVQEVSRSKWFNKIALAVGEQGVDTVADLPEDTLRDLLD